MKPKLSLIGLAVAGAFTLTVVIYATHRTRSVSAALADPAEPAAADPTATQLAAANASPQAQAYRQRQIFEQRVREFVRDGAKMGAVERSERAREIAQEIERREKNKELSAGEAVLLKISLIQNSIDDEAEKVRQVESLVAQYRRDAAQREAAWLAQQQRDARFQNYKAREAQIIAEVMAMQSFPNGLSRDEYLRLRLQEARETIYSR